MWSKRKFFASTTLALVRNRPRFLPPNLHPAPQSSGDSVFTRSFRVSCRARVPIIFSYLRSPESRGSDGDSCCSYGSESGGASRCWNCGAAEAADSPTPFLSCGACRSVQPVDDSVDYFQIFGLEKVFEIRDDNLDGKYKDWQKKLHPDLVHTKSEREKAYAAEQSARVIDAYRTLSKPLSRALYLLQLEGIHVDEEKTVMDPDLLAEMMEIREAVEEASDSQALKQIQSQVQTKLEAWSNSFQEAFKKQDFDIAIASIHRMRYYERALEEAAKKL